MHIHNTSSDQDQLDHAIHQRSDYVLQLVTGPATVAMHQCSLVFCCDQFDRGSRQVKHDPIPGNGGLLHNTSLANTGLLAKSSVTEYAEYVCYNCLLLL